MRSLSHARFSFLFILFALLLAAFQPCFAQSLPTRKAPPPPLPPPPVAVDHEQFISYWTTETGWTTELQLRNNTASLPLTVTPSLRTADGTETALSPVTINPQDVQTIDLESAIGTSAPQLIANYGSVVLRYHSPSYSNLFAVAMIRRFGHSIAFHFDGMGESQGLQSGSREGIWWLPNSSATDYLVLTNQGQDPLELNLSLYDSNGKSSTQNLTIPPRGLNRLSVRQAVTAAGLTGSYGGIKVSAVNHAGSLDTLHVLFDGNVGFSALMKMFDYDPRAQIKERDYAGTGLWTLRAPMLALSNPDPALAFPVGTTLHPQLFVRNTTGKPVKSSLVFNWRDDTVTGKSSPFPLQLNPFETRRIDVAALQNGKTLPQDARWASVTLTTNGLPDEVVAVAASYDSSLRFGAQTPFSDQLSRHWAGSMWTYDPLHGSIITVGNGGAKPTQAALTLLYNQGTQKYEMEQTLQPGQQMWVDIGKFIREGVPDKNGKTLPKNLTYGSYDIRDLTHKGVGTLFEGKITYDTTYGHVTYGCGTCCGYQDPYFLYDPLAIQLDEEAGQYVDARDMCAEQVEDVSDIFYGNWKVVNTGIATVDYYGNHTGVGVGATSSFTSGTLQANNLKLKCPNTVYGPSGPDNVNNITVHFNGSLAPGDSLSFSNVAQTCSSTLGLKDCSTKYPSTWVWNVEIEADVYDDAANYTVSQGVTGQTTGYYKASNGSLQSFSTSTNKPAPQDNPPSAVLQQTSGTKVIFWLDAPGRGTVYTDPNNSQNSGPIDSMTDVKNFTSSICTNANPSKCWSVNWYTEIIVKSGGTLDTVNSAAGFGTAP